MIIFVIRSFQFFATSQAIVLTLSVSKESPDSAEQCTGQ